MTCLSFCLDEFRTGRAEYGIARQTFGGIVGQAQSLLGKVDEKATKMSGIRKGDVTFDRESEFRPVLATAQSSAVQRVGDSVHVSTPKLSGHEHHAKFGHCKVGDLVA